MDLVDRMRMEKEFRDEVWALLEPQPGPADFVRGVRELSSSVEDNAYLAIILLLLFMGDQWAPFSPVVEEAMRRGSPVDGDIRRRARRLARWQVGRLERRLRRTNRDWSRRLPDEEFVGRAFGSERADTIAVTEVTTTINSAEFEAASIGRSHGVRIVGFWFTQLDERVCPVCAPLHGAPSSVWRRVFPRGAPAHVKCRCGVRWEVRNRA